MGWRPRLRVALRESAREIRRRGLGAAVPADPLSGLVMVASAFGVVKAFPRKLRAPLERVASLA